MIDRVVQWERLNEIRRLVVDVRSIAASRHDAVPVGK